MPDRSTPITIVGAGALGQALARSIHSVGRPVHAIVSRSLERGGALAEEVDSRRVEEPLEPAGEAVILCVPDDHIASVVERLKLQPGSILAHCAGSRGLDVLEHQQQDQIHLGSMHPVMVLAQSGRGADALEGATAAIDGDEISRAWLEQLAEDIGMRSVMIPPECRGMYHLSAALVGGLMTGLLAAAADLWEIIGLDRSTAASALGPMVQEAGRNLEALGVLGVVMGPAARGDTGTIRRHLEELGTHAPQLLPLYRELVLLSVPYALEQGLLDEQAAMALRSVVEAASD
ncbi:MAG: hypothetical protein CMJ39_03180 [Phycisphaerae bacterium]|nr:hypothetical protein [Phycisphaerae bacterium]